MGELDRLVAQRRSGSESFHNKNQELGFDLLDFWQWSSSDILSNAMRGVLAEYLVARAVGVADGVREEWAAYDLSGPHDTKIEVKSAAYLQSWYQQKLSSISFSCRKSLGWDAETNQQDREKRRHADVYVFALLDHQDKATVDPLDVSQWKFYVVPTFRLDQRTRSQHSITLASLERELGIKPVDYSKLREAVDAAGVLQRAQLAKGADVPSLKGQVSAMEGELRQGDALREGGTPQASPSTDSMPFQEESPRFGT